MDMISNGEVRYLRFIYFFICTSCILFIEPSLYDVILVWIFLIGFYYSFIQFHVEILFPTMLLLIFIESNFLSMFNVNYYQHSIYFFTITSYLILSWFTFVALVGFFREQFIKVVLEGYVIAALFSAVIGILAYFRLIPFYDSLIAFERVKSFFKDPNVFGPFLIPAALYSLYKTEIKNGFQRVLPFLTFILIVIAVFLSFSRAAWGNFFIATLSYLIFVGIVNFKKLFFILFLIIAVTIPIFLLVMNLPEVGDMFTNRWDIQSYDVDRFGTQEAAFSTGLSTPLGIGPGQVEEFFQYSTHSLFARVFAENGFIGLISLSGFFLICIFQSIRKVLICGGVERGYFIILTTSLLGILLNSFFVDTLHWRHFWLLLALPWCPNSTNCEGEVNKKI